MNIKNDPPMDTEISDLYQATKGDGPSAELDASILAQAEAAVAPKRKRPAWIAPVGLAATVLLGVNLAVNLKDVPSAPDLYSEAGQSVAVQTNLPELQAPSVTKAISDNFAKDETSGARELASAAFSMEESPLAQNEETNVSEGASSPGQAGSHADRVNQLLGQVSEQRRLRPSIENQRQSERARTERLSGEQKDAISRLAKRSDSLDATDRQELSDASNSVVSNRPPPTRRKHDVTASVAAAPEVDSYASAATLPVAQAAPPAPVVQNQMDSDTEESDIQEVIVTGSRAPTFNTSPHSRPTAKNQVKRNEYQRSLFPDRDASSAEPEDVSAETVSTAPVVYVCDLEAQRIDPDKIEVAKADALNLEPPLNALSWPGYIRGLAEEKNYLEACAHLAAYQQMYPGIVMIELLPVTILKQ